MTGFVSSLKARTLPSGPFEIHVLSKQDQSVFWIQFFRSVLEAAPTFIAAG